MRELCGRLLNECERLETALAAIDVFCGQNDIPFDGSRCDWRCFPSLRDDRGGDERIVAPASQSTREGSHQAIQVLARLQCEWTALARDLDALLYLDALPPEGTLKHAVLTSAHPGKGAYAQAHL